MSGSIIIRSSHYLSMKPRKHGATSNRILVELGTYILTFQPPTTFHLFIASLTQTISHIHILILKTHMAVKQKIHFLQQKQFSIFIPNDVVSRK